MESTHTNTHTHTRKKSAKNRRMRGAPKHTVTSITPATGLVNTPTKPTPSPLTKPVVVVMYVETMIEATVV
jgi:hypothetical protein